MEKRENIPRELGPNGHRVLEKMALYTYSWWIESEIVYYPEELNPLHFGADGRHYPDEEYCYYGRMHPEHGSVEILFQIPGCDRYPENIRYDGSVVFPEAKIKELWLQKCH